MLKVSSTSNVREIFGRFQDLCQVQWLLSSRRKFLSISITISTSGSSSFQINRLGYHIFQRISENNRRITRKRILWQVNILGLIINKLVCFWRIWFVLTLGFFQARSPNGCLTVLPLPILPLLILTLFSCLSFIVHLYFKSY